MKKMMFLKVFALLIFVVTFHSCGQKEVAMPSVSAEVSTNDEIDLGTLDLLKSGKLQGAPNQVLPHVQGATLPSQSEYEKIPVPNASERLNSMQDAAELRASGQILNLPPVMNQGREGSCVAFALGYGMMSFYLRYHRRMTYDNTANSAYRSPEFLYNVAKLPGDCDSGTSPISALNTLRYKGICSWADMPYSSTNGCSTQPNQYQLNRAAQAKIKSYFRLTTETQVKQYLDSANPVLLGFQIDTNFDAQTTNSPYVYYSVGGTRKENHVVIIKGYDDTNQVFICQNSWGKDLHYKGNFYISYNAFRRLNNLQLYVISGLEQ